MLSCRVGLGLGCGAGLGLGVTQQLVYSDSVQPKLVRGSAHVPSGPFYGLLDQLASLLCKKLLQCLFTVVELLQVGGRRVKHTIERVFRQADSV